MVAKTEVPEGNHKGLEMQFAKPLGKASEGESVTGVLRVCERERGGTREKNQCSPQIE